MRIYVASSWRNEKHAQVVTQLESAGFEVYDFKNPAPGDNGFHWSEVDGGYKNWTASAYRRALNHPISERGFTNDMEALKGCDALLLLLPCGRSAHIEAGWAVGAGKRVVVLLAEQNEPELMYKMTDAICVSVTEAIHALKGEPYMSLCTCGDAWCKACMGGTF